MSAVTTALASILPPGAVAVELEEAGEDDFTAMLHPAELVCVRDASLGRRREFAAGRECARRAVALLGVAAGPLPADADGAPLWPPGVVGSITHKGAYRAAAVARASDLAGLGIDAEHDAPLPRGVLGRIASADEIAHVERLRAVDASVHWDRVLFSAKEAVVKSLGSREGPSLDLARATVTLEPITGSFSAKPTGAAPDARTTRGRWACDSRLIVAVGVSRA